MGYVKTVEIVPVDYGAARGAFAAALRPVVVDFLEAWAGGEYFALRDEEGEIVVSGNEMVADPAKYAALDSDEEVIGLYGLIKGGDHDIFNGAEYQAGFEENILMPFLRETAPIAAQYERDRAAAAYGPVEQLLKERAERQDSWDEGRWDRKRKLIEDEIKEIDDRIAMLDREVERMKKQMDDASAIEKPRLERDIALLEIERTREERSRQGLVNELAALGRAEAEYSRTEPDIAVPAEYGAAVDELRELELDAISIKEAEGEGSEAYRQAMEKVEAQRKVVEGLWEAYEAELAAAADAKRAVEEAERQLVDDIQKRVDAAVKQFDEDMKRWKSEQEAALADADRQREQAEAMAEEREVKRLAVELSYDLFELAMRLRFSTAQSEKVTMGNVYQATEAGNYDNIKTMADMTAALLNNMRSQGLAEAQRMKEDLKKELEKIRAMQAAAAAADSAKAQKENEDGESKYFLV